MAFLLQNLPLAEAIVEGADGEATIGEVEQQAEGSNGKEQRVERVDLELCLHGRAEEAASTKLPKGVQKGVDNAKGGTSRFHGVAICKLSYSAAPSLPPS